MSYPVGPRPSGNSFGLSISRPAGTLTELNASNPCQKRTPTEQHQRRPRPRIVLSRKPLPGTRRLAAPLTAPGPGHQEDERRHAEHEDQGDDLPAARHSRAGDTLAPTRTSRIFPDDGPPGSSSAAS